MSPVAASAVRALARARAWGLLGDLFRRGLTPETLPAWRAADLAELPADPDPDRLAAAWTRLFLVELSPHESAFLSADGLLGGDVAGSVRADRARAGLGDPADLEADHLGAECGWLAFLSGAEADARRDGVDVAPLHRLQAEALDGHLLRWLPTLAHAVDGLAGVPGAGPYRAGLRLALDLAREQHLALGRPRTPWALPPWEDVLAAEDTGLRRIAASLCRPSQAGGVYTRPVLTAMGRALELPGGFGSRVDQLEGLLLSAAQYGRVPELCEALAAEAGRWAEGADPPWVERVEQTRAVLARVAREARANA